jgi:zona occludens toxin (predicted ATPase)
MSLFGFHYEAALFIADGQPGSGKSYFVSGKQVEWLLSGNPVITNLTIRSLPKFRVGSTGEYIKVTEDDFEVGEDGRLKLIDILIKCKSDHPKSHPLLVIDECHDIFNARNWKGNDKGGFFSWIAQHRHMGVSVLLVTQDYSLLDKALRVRCQEFWRFDNLVKDKSIGMFLYFIAPGIHRRICYSNRKGEPNSKKGYSIKFFRIRSDKARRYSSGQMHNLNIADTFRGKSDVPRKIGVFGLILVVVVLLTYGSRAFNSSAKPFVPVAVSTVYKLDDYEGKLESVYENDLGLVLVFEDGFEKQTTSTEISEYDEFIGKEMSFERAPYIARFADGRLR